MAMLLTGTKPEIKEGILLNNWRGHALEVSASLITMGYGVQPSLHLEDVLQPSINSIHLQSSIAILSENLG